MDLEPKGELEELASHLAGLAQDLQNLKSSIRTARALREGIAAPDHVWPEAPDFDPAADPAAPADWTAGPQEQRPAEEPGDPEPAEPLGPLLHAYPTFPV